MEKRWTSKSLLPERSGLSLVSAEGSGCGWVVQAEGGRGSKCPGCGAKSTDRHSRYWRTLRDLPMQGVPLTLRLRLSRWRCRNSNCKRKIFTERIPAVAAPHRQRTERMEEIIQLVGYSLGGRPAEKLMSRLGMTVSDDTILRLAKRRAAVIHSSAHLRVVGIDDWAWKKGQHYGTILVDLERRRVADLLPERSAEQVAQWLEQHSMVEFVSRDRFGLYAQAAQRGAPQAQQVADRFHLLMNLKEAVEQELSRQRRRLVVRPPMLRLETLLPFHFNCHSSPERAAHQQAIVSERHAAEQALFETVHRLWRSGKKASEVVKETGISRKRVDKWIRLTELPERNKMSPKPDSPAFFQDYLARRWSAGYQHVRSLLAELRPLGYTGCFSGLARFVSRWRSSKQPPPPNTAPGVLNDNLPDETAARHISSRVAAALLVKPRPFLTPAQAQKVDTLKIACPNFALMRGLVMEFRGILRGGKSETLDCWIQKADGSGIYSLKRFAKTLRRDWAAVRSALQEPFSNGPVEGHINRLKTIKRQMYGRAGFELLRARLLPPAHSTSTFLHQT